MPILTGSVGHKGKNFPKDVRLVEFLLNRAMPRMMQQSNGDEYRIRVFNPDSECTDETIEIIRLFQKKVAGFRWPDGRVDPGNRTIKALNAVFKSTGGVVRLDKNQFMSKIRDRQSARFNDAPLYLPRELKPGDLIQGLDGSRLVMSATRGRVHFILLDASGPGDEFRDLNPMRGHVGGYYEQNTWEFLDEHATIFGQMVARGLQPTKRNIETFLDVILGIIAGSHILGFASVIAIKGAKFYAENHEYLEAWYEIFKSVLRTRSSLKQYAPTLYEKVFNAGLLIESSERSARNINAHTAAYFAGVLMGTAGKTLMTGKINGILALLSVLWNSGTTLAKSGAEGAKEFAETFKDDIPGLVNELKKGDINVTQQEMAQIMFEVNTNHRQLQASLEDLHRTITANWVGF